MVSAEESKAKATMSAGSTADSASTRARQALNVVQ